MALVTITLEDTADGVVRIKLTSEPKADRANLTTAQVLGEALAGAALDYVKAKGGVTVNLKTAIKA